jgi:hypothetical protein
MNELFFAELSAWATQAGLAGHWGSRNSGRMTSNGGCAASGSKSRPLSTWLHRHRASSLPAFHGSDFHLALIGRRLNVTRSYQIVRFPGIERSASENGIELHYLFERVSNVGANAGRLSCRTKNKLRRDVGAKSYRFWDTAGLSFSLADGAFAATSAPVANSLMQNEAVSHEIALGEEEIADVSLATFYVLDKENAGPSPHGVRLACGCWTGTYYTSGNDAYPPCLVRSRARVADIEPDAKPDAVSISNRVKQCWRALHGG